MNHVKSVTDRVNMSIIYFDASNARYPALTGHAHLAFAASITYFPTWPVRPFTSTYICFAGNLVFSVYHAFFRIDRMRGAVLFTLPTHNTIFKRGAVFPLCSGKNGGGYDAPESSRHPFLSNQSFGKTERPQSAYMGGVTFRPIGRVGRDHMETLIRRRIDSLKTFLFQYTAYVSAELIQHLLPLDPRMEPFVGRPPFLPSVRVSDSFCKRQEK